MGKIDFQNAIVLVFYYNKNKIGKKSSTFSKNITKNIVQLAEKRISPNIKAVCRDGWSTFVEKWNNTAKLWLFCVRQTRSQIWQEVWSTYIVNSMLWRGYTSNIWRLSGINRKINALMTIKQDMWVKYPYHFDYLDDFKRTAYTNINIYFVISIVFGLMCATNIQFAGHRQTWFLCVYLVNWHL